jgi:hypothetical protein
MRSWKVILACLALAAAGLACAGWARAEDPYASYNRERAYRHFLNSPSPYRTYSSLQPGHEWGYETPLESGRFWRTPGYYNERITPFGRETNVIPQREGGYVVRRPPPVLLVPPVVPPRYPPPFPYP